MSSALIGTHSGSFHADEALGVWMLRRLDRFGGAGAKVVRSRDPEVHTLSLTHTYTYIRDRILRKSIPRKRIRKTPVRKKNSEEGSTATGPKHPQRLIELLLALPS